MKNLKKVLAMVLAFACTFTMFAGAKVFEDVPAGSDYSEAITMLSDLGIIQGKDDGKYHPEDTITRAEACAMIARLMTGDPNVSQYTGAQNFADVAKGSWKDSAIGYCYINNIVVGVGNNKFEPDRAITDAEFVTMVVRAMGYETPDMTQGYPYSYMSNAQAIGLLDGVNMVASTDALRGEDAQVIYNALFTDYARGALLVNTTHGTSVETYPTLAESVWGLDRAAVGTWTGKDDEEATLTNCKAHTWVVIGADPTQESHILAYPIDDDTTDLYDSKESNAFKAYSFKYEGDVDSIRGYQVELWGEGSHGEATWEKGDNKFVYSEDWTIKAIKTVKGQTKYDYNPSMADSKPENGTIVLDDTSLDLDTAATNASKVNVRDGGAMDLFVANDNDNDKKYNGVKISSDETLEEALNVRDGAQYQLMDWDGDGEIDWVVADQASYYKVESVTSSRVIVSSMTTKESWETSTTSVKDTWKIGSWNDDKVGNRSYKIKYEGADSLKEGDIIEVAYGTPAYDKGEKSEVVTATVSVVDAESKSLDKVSTKDGLTLTFDDTEIKVAQNEAEGNVIVPANPEKYKDFNSEELGTDFDLYMNRNGFIVYSDYTTETANYAMVLDTASGKDVVGSRNLAKVDLLTGEGKHLKDVELTSNASVTDGYTPSSRTIDEAKMVGNVYKYWTNEDGQITRMTQVIKVDNAIASTDYKYDADADRLIDTKNAGSTYVASLEDADVIFAVKPNTGSAATNAAAINTANAGYIQAETKNGVADLYVDVDDVLAVKQTDIPDIDDSSTDKTHTAKLDNKKTTRIQTWLGKNNDTGSQDYTNKFIAAVDNNGDASAAILGVDSFNKFGGGNTKIGLVTDVTYSNSSDGKYVELTAAFGGENKTIASAKKVDFDDIVKVYDSRTGTDIAVGSETSTINYNNKNAQTATDNDSGLYNSTSLDVALEKSAAYAEITTDADGNLTKVVFLDEEYNNTKTGSAADTDNNRVPDKAVYNVNKVVGHYYNVSRNVTIDSNGKSVNYLLNDGTTQRSALDSATFDAAQIYADNSNLYSINYLAKQNNKLDSEAKFYEIDGKPTLQVASKSDYKGAQMSVVKGFDGTPDITVSDDYGSIGVSSIDTGSDKDAYEVSDIAFKNNNNDIIAVYSFKGELGEVDGSTLTQTVLNNGAVQAGAANWTDIANLSLFNGADFQITRQPYTTLSNGGIVEATDVTAQLDNNSNTKLNATSAKVQIKAGNTAVAGTYKMDVLVTPKKGDAQTVTLSFTVGAINSKSVVENVNVTNKTASTVTVKVTGTVVKASTSVTGGDPITDLLASNFKVADKSGATYTVKSAVQKGLTGEYELTVDGDFTNKTAVVTVTTATSAVSDVYVDTDLSTGAGTAADKNNSTVETTGGDAAEDLKVTVKDNGSSTIASLTENDFIVKVDGVVRDDVVVADKTGGVYNFHLDGVDLTKANVEIYVGNVTLTSNGSGETDPTVQADGVKVINANGEELIGGAAAAKEVYFQLKNGEKVLDTKIDNVQVINSIGLPVSGYTISGTSKGIYMISKTDGSKIDAGTYTIGIGETKVADIKVESAKTIGTVKAAAGNQVEYYFGGALTYNVTGTVGYSKEEIMKMSLGLNKGGTSDQTNVTAQWVDEKSFTILPAKDGTWLAPASDYQVFVNGSQANSLTLEVTTATLTVADAKTDATPTITLKLQHDGEDLDTAAWTALGLATDLSTSTVKVNVNSGGEKVASAVDANTAPTVTITADDTIATSNTVVVNITDGANFTITGGTSINVTNNIK